MKPTPKLRFVEREAGFEQYDVKVTERHGTEVCYRPKKIRILQQWWDDDSWKHVNSFDADGKHISTGKWIDIPLETEE